MNNGLEAILVFIVLLYFLIDFILILTTISLIKLKTFKKDTLRLSIIIAARNESHNLKKHLPTILGQNHPHFEVIVVDDQSTDNTESIIWQFQKQYSFLKYIKVKHDIHSSKKHAIQLGIKEAKNKFLVFTDADCKPLSSKWLSTVQHYFKQKSSVVIGYSPYQKRTGLLNKIIRFETYQTAVNYFGLAKLGLPYMGVGRNLCYTKSVFSQSNGFKSHQHLLSGDDDLLINKVSGKANFACCLEPESFVESLPETSLNTWINQKQRHYSTAPSYKIEHQLLLGLQFVLKFLFWFIACPLAVYLDVTKIGFPLLSFTLLGLLTLKLFVNSKLFSHLLVKDLWIISYILEIQLICLQLYIFTLNLVSPKQNW